ncbi:MAG: DUF1501 domain-containing protein [Asticcacaulis sp.]
MLHRRRFLSSLALGAGAVTLFPGLALAAAHTDRRFVFIIQRGAADGLDVLRPYADPDFNRLRRPLLEAGELGTKLDGTFALHPSLGETASLYQAGQALLVHAVASPYRDRSHFDGQNVLETGGTQPYAIKDGWLNRLLALAPQSGDAIAIGNTIPMALRGKVGVGSYAPSDLSAPSEDLKYRVAKLYGEDERLHPLWASATEAQMLAGDVAGRQGPEGMGRLTASFLARPDGPRIAMIETTGWDTHNAQATRLSNQLKSLDRLIAGLKSGLGSEWDKTVVLVATEFGRTAALNGTNGTDHGTGSAALILGGAVKGGRVIADWPGLAPSNLYEGRDLKPTLSLDRLIASTAAQALNLDPDRVRRDLFPAIGTAPLLDGLVSPGRA